MWPSSSPRVPPGLPSPSPLLLPGLPVVAQWWRWWWLSGGGGGGGCGGCSAVVVVAVAFSFAACASAAASFAVGAVAAGLPPPLLPPSGVAAGAVAAGSAGCSRAVAAAARFFGLVGRSGFRLGSLEEYNSSFTICSMAFDHEALRCTRYVVPNTGCTSMSAGADFCSMSAVLNPRHSYTDRGRNSPPIWLSSCSILRIVIFWTT